MSSANKASKINNTMFFSHQFFKKICISAIIVGLLTSCSTSVQYKSVETQIAAPVPQPRIPAISLGDILQPKSRWAPVTWSDLPGWSESSAGLLDAWRAWSRSCQNPATSNVHLCADVRRLVTASEADKRVWMMQMLQPYRVESVQGQTEGLLTSYYEPVLDASRKSRPGFQVPVYRVPSSLSSKTPWYTRQEVESASFVKAQLKGLEIAYLADPIDAMVLHIQGSGRLNILEPDGSRRTVRLAFAATNEHTYKSIGRWLLDQGAAGTRDVSWPGIKNWLARNPQRVNELLWSNPRYVFFREESMPDTQLGPKGAQGVPLTPGHSIAVDRASIPYGTPVWLSSVAVEGDGSRFQKLVLAQDTGGAILGAVRADYFMGWGKEAGDLAGRVKQPLYMWVLWPKSQ